MELHIYRENVTDTIVKDHTKQKILYFIESKTRLFSGPLKEVYLPSKSNRHLATISYEGMFCPENVIKIHPREESINLLRTIGLRGYKFRFQGRKFWWQGHGERELVDSETKEVIARFEKTTLAWKKKGVLRIKESRLHLQDIILLTFITVLYRMEEQSG